MSLFDRLTTKIRGQEIKIVFPEGNDPRILKAAVKLVQQHLITPVLLGTVKSIQDRARQLGLSLSGIKILNPDQCSPVKYQRMLEALVLRRHGKTSRDQARQWLKNPNYFGTMLVYMHFADGMVSGANHSTADTVLPALQIIKTQPGIKRVSGAFLMVRGARRLVFADCAINLQLSAAGMCEVARESARTARFFGMDPKIAMLSFSTKGSAQGKMVTKVQQATRLVHKQAPKLPVDGELQLDAALSPTVAKKKAPHSRIAGHANVLIFPELQSGNIGYKLVQRLGGFEALGPILQGLKYPVSDLSRGCNAEDVYKIAIINAVQSLK